MLRLSLPCSPGTRRRAWSSALLVAIVVVLGATPSTAAMPVVVLSTNEADEYSASASAGYLVWTQNSAQHRGAYNSFAKPAGQPRIRVNAPHTRSYAATVWETTVVYERSQLGPGKDHENDLRLYDLVTGNRTSPGPGVNTAHAEYEGGITDRFLFFTRSNFEAPLSEQRTTLILYDRANGHARVLATHRRSQRHYLISDQINGDWVVWEDCRITREFAFTDCNVFRYRISTKRTVRLPNPGKQQFASAVTSDGTVYFARVGGSDAWQCGKHAKLLRYPVGGPATVIASLPQGKDDFSMFALEEADTSATLYFDREDCRTFDRDIYKIENADTA